MCTAVRFTDKNGNMFWGRNLDWECGYGQHVVAAPAAWNYEWVYGGERPHKHDIIGMAIIVKDERKQDVPLFFDIHRVFLLTFLVCVGLYVKPFFLEEE